MLIQLIKKTASFSIQVKSTHNQKTVFCGKLLKKKVPINSYQFFLSQRRFYGTESVASKIPLKVKCRIASQTDLEMVKDWAIQEGWNPGIHESAALHAADPKGYYILDVDDKPVASLAAVKYAKTLGFLGLYMVKPEFRGLGYGKKLWDEATSYLHECESVGLNGVIDQIDNYKKSGFKSAFLSTRWTGNLNAHLPKEIDFNDEIILKHEPSLTALIDYDAAIFSVSRSNFLSNWLKMPESHTVAAYKGDQLKGYGVISKVNDGYKIAPLFADNVEIAGRILQELSRYLKKNENFYIDISEANDSAMNIVTQFGLKKSFSVSRMYKGETPKFDNQKMFGLTTLEIG